MTVILTTSSRKLVQIQVIPILEFLETENMRIGVTLGRMHLELMDQMDSKAHFWGGAAIRICLLLLELGGIYIGEIF